MRYLLWPFRILYVLYAMALFVALMIPVFLFGLAVLPLGRIRGGNLIFRGCSIWADIWFFLIFVRHRNIYHQKPAKGRAFIFVANHISYFDSAVIPKTFRQPIRPLGKVEMVKIPVFGFIYKNTIVTVDRSSAANRSRSVQTLRSILRKGISVLVFPEGTFNMSHQPLKHFYDGAFRLAIETGTPIMPVLLMDTYDRMHYRSIFSLNPGRSRSVFLPEVSVEGLAHHDLTHLKARVHAMMEEELRKRGATWIQEKNG